MLTLILAGQLLSEKNKRVKIIGALCLVPLYRAMLFCGFATPIALFIIGHILFAFSCFLFGKKDVTQFMIRMFLTGGLLVGSVVMVYKISQSEDDSRLRSIQTRFQKMLENPRGGGYDVEHSRFDLIYISMETFKENPIFGAGGGYMKNRKTGGHQAMFDYFALYGIVGGGAFTLFALMCFWNAFQRCKQEKDWATFGRFGATGMFLIVGMVNPCWLGGPLTALFIFANPFRIPQRRFVLNKRTHFNVGMYNKERRDFDSRKNIIR